MQITFAGTIIGQEGDFFGFDTIQGFLVKGKGTSEWQGAIGATDDIPFARNKRRRTIVGTITPPPLPTLEEAMLVRSTQYNNLPDAGELVIQVGNTLVTFVNAVLDEHDPVEDPSSQGHSASFKLTFFVGVGVTTQAALQAQSGAGLLSQAGTPLQPQQPTL